jgi:cathepsin L
MAFSKPAATIALVYMTATAFMLCYGVVESNAVQTKAEGKTRWHQLSESYTFANWCDEFADGCTTKYSSSAEKAQRENVFRDRLATILKHNADPTQTWKRGVNHLTDRTVAELKMLRGGDGARVHHERSNLNSASASASATASKRSLASVQDLPASVDWRAMKNGKSAITPVKNQGSCGSCWAFASTETIESHWFLKTGEMQELAEQFILDCTPNPKECGGKGGCQGGTAALAFDRLKVLGGIPSEWTYPYVSGTGNASVCHGLPLVPEQPHHGGVMAAANVTGHVSLPTNSYTDMLHAVATVGPLTVTVDAGAWHDYESGVFTGGNHTNPDLDHLVQLIGYGTDEQGGDYWTIRNSWTPKWGENGFIRLARHGTSGSIPCGMDITPLDGDGCKGGPAQVKVCGQSGVLYDGAYPLVL